MFFLKIVFSFAFDVLFPFFAEYQSSRTGCTADNQVGTCILVRNCQLVANILQQSRDEAIGYLRRNHCGFNGVDPMVCCITNNMNVNTRPGGTATNPGINTGSPTTTSSQSFDASIPIDLANNPLLPSDCGRDLSQRIVGGERTELDEFPWMALLEYQKRKLNER